MVAAFLDVVVEQGGTFSLAVEVRDSGGVNPRTDLAGWTGEFKIYSRRDPASALLATGTVTIDVANGVATATIADDLTGAMDWSSGQYDMWITNGTDTEPLAWGTARFRRTVIT